MHRNVNVERLCPDTQGLSVHAIWSNFLAVWERNSGFVYGTGVFCQWATTPAQNCDFIYWKIFGRCYWKYFLPLNVHSSHGVYVTPGVSASLHTAVGFHRATYEPLVPVPGKHGVAMTTEGKEL